MLDRGLRYGDGFFDTMLMLNGKPVWSHAHWERMVNAAKKIDVSWPNLDSILSEGDPYASWLQEIQEKWDKAGRPTVARARTVVWRLGDGDYFPTTSEFDSHVRVDSFEPHANKEFSLGPSTIVQCPPMTPWFKSLSAMPYILAAKYARDRGWDDALLMDSHGKFIESSRSNLFYWMNGCCYTPSINSGCLPGIAAQYLIQFLASMGHNVQFATATHETLLNSTGIWLTNSLRGIIPVHQWDHQKMPV
ncbi:MAG: aminotransferase class IV, partial [Bacteroidota bacterium]